MPAFLIVHSACQDGRLDAYSQPPTIDVGGLRAPLDWGDITLHAPAGDLPVTIFVTRTNGQVEGATITVRTPDGTGTRLTFVPPLQPGGHSMLRIDGQWPADSSMHYYAARDARMLTQARPVATAQRPATPSPAVGPTPGSTGSVPTQPSRFGHEQGARVDPVRSSAEAPVESAPRPVPPHLGPRPADRPGTGHGGPEQAGPAHPPSFGQRQPRTERDVYGREHAADGKQAPPIPTPAQFQQLEHEAADAQRRVYEAWQEQQRAERPQPGPSPHDGAPQPIGLQANTGQAQPGWYADPFRRAEQRWFDGRQWSSSVMRGGVRGTDQPG